MVKLVLSIIIVVMLVWMLFEYIRWRKNNKIQEELEESVKYEAALRSRAKTLKTNIKNVGVSKALDDLEDDLDDDFIDLDSIYQEVENVIQPDSFKKEFENQYIRPDSEMPETDYLKPDSYRSEK